MEIDPTLNNGLTAEMLCAGSGKEIIWKMNHVTEDGRFFTFVWPAVVKDRTKRGDGCPYISGHKIWTGYNDLRTKNPRLAAEWHPTKNGRLRPEDCMPNEKTEVWWLVYAPHPVTQQMVPLEWHARIDNRNAGQGCPYLGNNGYVLTGFNDCATTDAYLLSEWDEEKNTDANKTLFHLSRSSMYKAHWKCPHGHSWEARIADRTRGCGCRFCNESHGEKRIANYLNGKNIAYQREFKFPDCKDVRPLPFDFCVFSQNNKIALLIEYDGEQHRCERSFGRKKEKDSLENIKRRDKIKTNYCVSHNYPLLRIPFTEFENVEEIVQLELQKLNIIA